MARARRVWSTMRTEVRRLLRETVAADSFWTDPELLDYFNHAIDLRVMILADQHEGWVTDTYDADLVANQNEYLIPEGTGRIKRILIVNTEGERNKPAAGKGAVFQIINEFPARSEHHRSQYPRDPVALGLGRHRQALDINPRQADL